MRLLLDEMLSPAIARELRERGHDVLAAADHFGWVALSDAEVMALARTERRAVVTKEDIGRIIAALEGKLAEYPGDEDLANGECWL